MRLAWMFFKRDAVGGVQQNDAPPPVKKYPGNLPEEPSPPPWVLRGRSLGRRLLRKRAKKRYKALPTNTQPGLGLPEPNPELAGVYTPTSSTLKTATHCDSGTSGAVPPTCESPPINSPPDEMTR